MSEIHMRVHSIKIKLLSLHGTIGCVGRVDVKRLCLPDLLSLQKQLLIFYESTSDSHATPFDIWNLRISSCSEP